MSGDRILRFLAVLLVIGALVQFLLVGTGLFSTSTFTPHVMLGHTLGILAILMPIVAIVSRLGIRAISLSVLVFVLYGLQYATIESGGTFAVVHPLSGSLILLTAAALALGDRLVLGPRVDRGSPTLS